MMTTPLAARRRAQAMTETVILIVLCAIGLLLVVTIFGNDIKDMFWTSSQSIREGKQQSIQYGDGFDGANANHDTANLDAGGDGTSGGGGGTGGAGAGSGDGSSAGSDSGTDNPYLWNASAQRWYDPETNLFVSFAEAGKYVDDPYMYYSAD